MLPNYANIVYSCTRLVDANPSNMADDQRATLEKFVQKICDNEKITNPVVEYSTNTPKNGYIGNMVKVKIIGDNKELRLVAKCASSEESFRENFLVREMFLQEIKFYEELVPLCLTLQERYGAKHPFTSTAKCYGCSDTPKAEFIILEDLFHADYKLKDSLHTMNVEHIQFVLNEYAKYHAIYFAYKHHDYEGYQKLVKNMVNIMDIFVRKETSGILVNCLKNLRDLLDPNDDFFDAYSKICEDAKGYFGNSVLTDEHAVLMHGDSWCNNMMFKYKDDLNHPTSMKLLDFQVMGPCSVATDVSYFLMANSPPEVIKNADHYLKFYYDNLAKYLLELNVEPDEIFPYSTFKDQWKKYSLYGLVMAITALKFAMAGADQKPDLAKDSVNAVNFVGEHDDEYRARTEAVIKYYHKAGII